jgi:hypothetical protein
MIQFDKTEVIPLDGSQAQAVGALLARTRLVPRPPEDVPVGQTLEVLAKMAEVFAPTS